VAALVVEDQAGSFGESARQMPGLWSPNVLGQGQSVGEYDGQWGVWWSGFGYGKSGSVGAVDEAVTLHRFPLERWGRWRSSLSAWM